MTLTRLNVQLLILWNRYFITFLSFIIKYLDTDITPHVLTYALHYTVVGVFIVQRGFQVHNLVCGTKSDILPLRIVQEMKSPAATLGRTAQPLGN
jgi:hypothetical protein